MFLTGCRHFLQPVALRAFLLFERACEAVRIEFEPTSS
jgi:hypothetical protein